MSSSLSSSSCGSIPADFVQSARARLIQMNHEAMKALNVEMDRRARIHELLNSMSDNYPQMDCPRFTITHLPDAPHSFRFVARKPYQALHKVLPIIKPEPIVAPTPELPASSISSSAPTTPNVHLARDTNITRSAPAKTSPPASTTSSASSSSPKAQSAPLLSAHNPTRSAPAKTSPPTASTTSSASSSAPAAPSVVTLPTAAPSKVVPTYKSFNEKKIIKAYPCLKKMRVLSCDLKKGGVQGPNGPPIEYIVPGEVRLTWSLKQQGRTITKKEETERVYDSIPTALSKLISQHLFKRESIVTYTEINSLRPDERNTRISFLGTEWFWIQSALSDTKKLYKKVSMEEASGCPIEQRISWIDGTRSITLIPAPNDTPPDLTPFLAWLKAFQGVSKTV